MITRTTQASSAPRPFESECLKPRCSAAVPEGYGFQLCPRHLAKAWAAFEIIQGRG